MGALRILCAVALACVLLGHTQGSFAADDRTVVGVTQFTCDEESPYTGLVTEKVVEMLTNTHRFVVVDRTSHDKVMDELELQKSEAFLDSRNLADQGAAVAAEQLVTGHIVKIPVYRMRNSDGNTRGYKASVAFQLKVVDVATGVSNEAQSFDGKCSKEMLSPESAVTAAMQSLQSAIYEYFRVNFPVRGKVLKSIDKGTILVNVGKDAGIRVGDTFMVESVEMLDGKPYPTELGKAKVTKLSGESFAECSVSGKVATAIENGKAAHSLVRCSLIIKK